MPNSSTPAPVGPLNPVYPRVTSFVSPARPGAPLWLSWASSRADDALFAHALFLVTEPTPRAEVWADRLTEALEQERAALKAPTDGKGPALGNCLDAFGLAVCGGVRIAPVPGMGFPGENPDSNLWAQRLLVVLNHEPDGPLGYASFDLVWESNKHGVGAANTSLTVDLLEVWLTPTRRGLGLGAELMEGVLAAIHQNVRGMRTHLSGLNVKVPVSVRFAGNERNAAGEALLQGLARLARETLAGAPLPGGGPLLVFQGFEVKAS